MIFCSKCFEHVTEATDTFAKPLEIVDLIRCEQTVTQGPYVVHYTFAPTKFEEIIAIVSSKISVINQCF